MWAKTFYDLDQDEKSKPKYEWDENDEPMFDWILKRAQERYKDWKYQCHKAYMKEWPSGMPSDFMGERTSGSFYASTSSQMRSRDSPWQTSGTVGRKLCTTTRGLLLSFTQWRNSEYKGSSFQLSKVLRRPMSGLVMKIRPRNIMTSLMRSINERMHLRNNTLTQRRRRLWRVFSPNKLRCWVRCSKLGKERRSEGWDEEASET